jgi:tetratricopeptide (TPR) repeat protein
MIRLRIVLIASGSGTELRLEFMEDNQIESAITSFEFVTTDEDAQNIRWYLEDYLLYPAEPAPAIAERVEKRMREIGEKLFAAIFSSPRTRFIWSLMEPSLGEARIEIADETRNPTVPWELALDPVSGKTLATGSAAFVRNFPAGREGNYFPTAAGEVRILLVISRPGGKRDVGFRATAKHIVDQFYNQYSSVNIHVLRPSTFTNFQSILWAAYERGAPYHIVHFDGHGTWTDLAKSTGLPLGGGARGYVIFEGNGPSQGAYVDGSTMGDLLQRCGVPILLLNACRSAHHDPTAPTDPLEDDSQNEFPARAYGSFAQEVCDAGVPGVVAMRYNIYVVTAARFVGNLYKALLSGEYLGQAVTSGRRLLATQPLREVTTNPRPLQDWIVPIVYETYPLRIFQPSIPGQGVKPTVLGDVPTAKDSADHDYEEPRFGFFGRDDTLYDLDRTFTSHNLLLLHGYAGEGKTASATEFVRWYTRTGGTTGPSIYTSFRSAQTVESLIDEIGKAFDRGLEFRGGAWYNLPLAERRQLAIELLGEFSTLWIWDNFELLTEDEANSRSDKRKRTEIISLLTELESANTKVLITSTRPEAWLGDLVSRVAISPMPMLERLQLARAITGRHGIDTFRVEEWTELLKYTRGNPLSVILLVSQAVQAGFRTKANLDAFAARLEAGDALIEEGDSRTAGRLGSALDNILRTEFTPEKLKLLSLLSLFRRFVDHNQLMSMNPLLVEMYPGSEHPPYSRESVALDSSNPLHELINLQPEHVDPILDRCVELGLFTPWQVTEKPLPGAYHIHPAVAWHLKRIFTENFGSTESRPGSDVVYYFVGSYAQQGSLARYFVSEQSSTKSMFVLQFEVQEPSMLHALRLAVSHNLWSFVPHISDGLRILYTSTGRMTDWARCVSDILPAVVDPDSGEPVPGREELWESFIGYRVDLAAMRRDWDLIEQLARSMIHSFRAARDTSRDTQSGSSLAHYLKMLAEALSLKERDDEAVSLLREAIEIYRDQGDQKLEADTWFMMGNTLRRQGRPDAFDEAESCYRRSIALGDHQNETECIGQLAGLFFSRFVNDSERMVNGRVSEAERERWIECLEQAIDGYNQYIDLQPEADVHHRAHGHAQLGRLYARVNTDDPLAMNHFHEAIELFDFEGDRYQAGHVREEMSIVLGTKKRYQEALLYARAALDDFTAYDQGTEEDIERASQIISGLERLLAHRGEPFT